MTGVATTTQIGEALETYVRDLEAEERRAADAEENHALRRIRLSDVGATHAARQRIAAKR